MTKKKYIAEIIPAVNLPRDLMQFFSYEIPKDLQEKIQIGDAVKIPLRKKEVFGIVKSFSKEDKKVEFEIKKITDIEEKISLTEKQLELAEFIFEYYYAPLSLVIKIMFPEITKKSARAEIDLNPFSQIGEMEKETSSEIIKKINQSSKNILLHNLDCERHSLYESLIKKQDKDSQALLMLPEFFDVYNLAKFYIDAFGENQVAILCSDITRNQYWREWQKVKSGEAKIVIGTRQTVFAPFQNLKLIIVDEEHNSSYKQWDQNPRYHGVETAIKLAEIHKAKIILSSPTPSLETYHRTLENFKLINISEKIKKYPQIVDMDVERKNGNYSFISEKLEEELLEKIYNKKQALIFIPRLGEKTIHQCKDCGHIAECEICQNPLIGYKGKLYCSRCKQLYKITKDCPKCHGHNISAFGGGSQRIFEEIEKIFENKNIKIFQLDSSTSQDNKQNQRIYKDFQEGRIDILVGTQMIWKNWQMHNLELVCIIFPEIIFSAPGFRSNEKSWQFLGKVYNLAKNKTVIIETRKPDHRFFQEIKNKSVETFLEGELKNRQEGLSPIPYPPLGKIIKLIYKNPDARTCEKEAKWQYEILQKEIFEHHWRETFEIVPPFPAQNYREYGKYRWHIIIKHKPDISIEIRDSILTYIKKDWIIDIDPDEIL
ncbi:MAG: primosomal protein N' [Candidatus Paceibacterota bacterium]